MHSSVDRNPPRGVKMLVEESFTVDLGSERRLADRTERQFSADGVIQRAVFGFEPEKIVTCDYFYEGGTLTRVERRNARAELLARTLYEYEVNGLPRSETTFANGEAVTKREFSYDADGSVLTTEVFRNLRSVFSVGGHHFATPPTRRQVARSSPTGILTNVVFFDDREKVVATLVFGYDERRHLTTSEFTIHLEDGEPVSLRSSYGPMPHESVIELSGCGDSVVSRASSSDDVFQHLEFDERGNWIGWEVGIVEGENKVITSIVRRTIEYY
jgi:hypothetical protein